MQGRCLPSGRDALSFAFVMRTVIGVSSEKHKMRKAKKEQLNNTGWKAGSAQEFLGLSDEEAVLIEMKLALASSLKERRRSRGWTQEMLAKRLGSSQSRVAKMEAADATVSIDLLIQSLLVLGATRQQLGRIIGRKTAEALKSAGLNWTDIIVRFVEVSKLFLRNTSTSIHASQHHHEFP